MTLIGKNKEIQLHYFGNKICVYDSDRFTLELYGNGYYFHGPERDIDDSFCEQMKEQDELLEWDGDYLLLLNDKKKQEKILYNSHINAVSVFWCEMGNSFILSNDLIFLAKRMGMVSWNTHAIADYFEQSWNNILKHERTPFCEIHRMVGSQYFVEKRNAVYEGKIENTIKRERRYKEKDFAEFQDEYLGIMKKHLDTVLKEEMRMSFSVSGGIDSGTLACLAKKWHKNLDYYYFSTKYDDFEDESKLTKTLETKLDAEIDFIKIECGEDLLGKIKQLICITGCPYSGIEGVTFWEFFDGLRQKMQGRLITGFGADVTFGGTPYEYLAYSRELVSKGHIIRGYYVYEAFLYGTGDTEKTAKLFRSYVKAILMPKFLKTILKKLLKTPVDNQRELLLKIELPQFESTNCQTYAKQMEYAQTGAALRQMNALQNHFGIIPIAPFESSDFAKLSAKCDPYIFMKRENKHALRRVMTGILPDEIVNNRYKYGSGGYKKKLYEKNCEQILSYLADRRSMYSIVDIEKLYESYRTGEQDEKFFCYLNLLIYEDILRENDVEVILWEHKQNGEQTV